MKIASTLACLEYGVSGPSCQQVCLVCEPCNTRILVSVTFISLFSKHLSQLIDESQSILLDDVPTIILPVHSRILRHLLGYLSKGIAMFETGDDALAVGEAADILGITNVDWNIEYSVKKDVKEEPLESEILIPKVTKSKENNADLKTSLNSHVNEHLKKKTKYLCNICSNSFKLSSSLVRHVQDAHTTKEVLTQRAHSGKHVCNICGKGYTSSGALMAHNWFKHSETSNILCKGIDKKERKVEIEEMIENDEGLWKCKRCGKTASQKSYLKHHVVTHIEGMTHVCKICSKTYETRFNLQQHLSDVHSGLFCCGICGKSNMSRAGYRTHRQKNHRQDS